MPTYVYECTCGHSYEETRSIHADGPDRCPACGLADGDGFRQWFGNGLVAIVRGNVTTLGQQGEVNARRAPDRPQAGPTRSRWTGPLPEGAKINTTGTGERPWFREAIGGEPALDKPLDVSKLGGDKWKKGEPVPPRVRDYIEGK